MLTPVFELRQNEDTLIVDIKAPYVKASELDVFFEDFDFKFFCKPYFLRLNLPGKVLYQEEPSVHYDFDSGTFTIRMPKAVPGEHFEDLDLLTKLLAPKSKGSNIVPKIEVIGEVSYDDDVEDFDWEVDQDLFESQEEEKILLEAKCGFGCQYPCTIFSLKEEASEIFDFDVSHFNDSVKIRFSERLAAEASHFSDDHYLGDLYEGEEIMSLLEFQTDWENILQAKTNKKCDEIAFTAEEKERLRRLPNKEYILEKNEKKALMLGLVDIIFAYAYNKRVTEGENTVESAWTINKLSSTLSWMEVFTSVPAVLQSCVRRSLIYPLFRHWELAMRVVEDTRMILSLGRKYVLKCLLEIRELFCSSDPRYILNDLYITDYCVWLQGKCCRSSNLFKLSDALGKIKLKKEDVGLDIPELEYAAKLALSENSALDSLVENVSKINLNGETNSSTEVISPRENKEEKLSRNSHTSSSNSSSGSSDSDTSDETDNECSSKETTSDKTAHHSDVQQTQ